MSLFGTLVRFGMGVGLGGAIGATAGLLLAPGSGSETRAAVADRIQRARLAGVDARAATEQELISRFRTKVDDVEALREIEFASKNQHVTALANIKDSRPSF